MKRRVFGLLSAAVILGLGIAAVVAVGKSADRTGRAHLLEQAQITAAALDARDVRRLSGGPADLPLEEYRVLKEGMTNVRASVEDSRFVYLMGMREGQLFFFADSEPADSEDYSAPGDAYAEADPIVLESFAAGRSAVVGPYRDRWGTWVSAFASVPDPETKAPLAMVGIDIDAHAWQREIRFWQALPAMVTLFFLVFLWGYGRYRDRRREFLETITTQDRRLRSLYEIAAMSDVEGDKTLQAALERGRSELGLDIGIISRVEGDVYTVEQVIAPGDIIKPGDVFSFERMYCALTYAADGVVGIEHAGASKYKAHACYKDFKLEAYIGVPLEIDGKKRGTLCFSAAAPRPKPFTEADKDFLLLLGKWVTATLERKWSRARLLEVDQMKSEFVSVASHQLRTPLTGIKWFCQLLLAGKAGTLKPDQIDFIAQVNASNERMIKLVEDLLNVSRIETGHKFEIVKKPLDVVALVRSVLQEHAPLAAKRSQNVEFHAPGNFPVMDIDEQKIRQVLGNLVSNALKYSPEGSTVEVRLVMDGKTRAAVSVTDHGIGIPAEQQKRIFGKFFRAANAVASETDGTGLGLFIAKSICEAHGGSLTFTTVEGKGSTFTAMF